MVGVSGQFDPAGAATVWRAIQDAVDQAVRSSVVVLDLSIAGVLDSLGLTALVDLQRRSRREKIELRVVAEPDRIVRRAPGSSVDDTVPVIHDSLESALADPPALRRDTPIPPPVSSPRTDGRG